MRRVGGRSAVVLVTIAGEPSNPNIATVQTDKEDYLPPDTVVVTGAGWEPGETVSLLVHELVDPPVQPDITLSGHRRRRRAHSEPGVRDRLGGYWRAFHLDCHRAVLGEDRPGDVHGRDQDGAGADRHVPDRGDDFRHSLFGERHVPELGRLAVLAWIVQPDERYHDGR